MLKLFVAVAVPVQLVIVISKRIGSQKFNPADDDEESMLDQAFDVQKNSRLSCQIPFTEELNGINVDFST